MGVMPAFVPSKVIVKEVIDEKHRKQGYDQEDFETEKYGEELEMPMSYGIGIAYRASDSLTISGDIFMTEWDDFEYKHADGSKTSPVSGLSSSDSDVDATTWFRLGGEYSIITEKYAVPIRAGIFYDPAPAEGSEDDFYGVSIGFFKEW